MTGTSRSRLRGDRTIIVAARRPNDRHHLYRIVSKINNMRFSTASHSAATGAGVGPRMTHQRYDVMMTRMSTPKRSTIYFDPDIHRALRLKAAASERSISDVVNDAVRQTLSEDAADLEVFEKRRREPVLDFEEVVLTLRRSGKL